MIDALSYRSLTLLAGAMLSWGALAAQETGGVVGHIVDHVREVECGGTEMAVAHIGVVVLPALEAGLGAHSLGATDVSQGRAIVAAAAASSALAVGVGVMITSSGGGFGAQDVVRSTLVGFAAPALATFADYLFRSPRDNHRAGTALANP